MKKCNKGMTMIEILVAFVMLTMVMLIMYGCMKFASNILKEATDIDRNNAEFQEAVAKEFVDETGYKLGTVDSITYTFEGSDDKGNSVGPISYTLNTANVSFKRSDSGYEKVTSDTTDNIRKLYIFSTGN